MLKNRLLQLRKGFGFAKRRSIMNFLQCESCTRSILWQRQHEITKSKFLMQFIKIKFFFGQFCKDI